MYMPMNGSASDNATPSRTKWCSLKSRLKSRLPGVCASTLADAGEAMVMDLLGSNLEEFRLDCPAEKAMVLGASKALRV